jgi:hypothetical protein
MTTSSAPNSRSSSSIAPSAAFGSPAVPVAGGPPPMPRRASCQDGPVLLPARRAPVVRRRRSRPAGRKEESLLAGFEVTSTGASDKARNYARDTARASLSRCAEVVPDLNDLVCDLPSFCPIAQSEVIGRTARSRCRPLPVTMKLAAPSGRSRRSCNRRHFASRPVRGSSWPGGGNRSAQRASPATSPRAGPATAWA